MYGSGAQLGAIAVTSSHVYRLLQRQMDSILAGRGHAESADMCGCSRAECRASHDGGLSLLLLLLYAADNLMHSGGDILNRAHVGVILHLPVPPSQRGKPSLELYICWPPYHRLNSLIYRYRYIETEENLLFLGFVSTL